MRFRVCMIILILAGVLTGGIGAGTAIAEFSDMAYEGTVWLGSENTTDTKLIYEIEDEATDRIYCYSVMNMQEETTIIENRKVPLDQIWFEITYDPDMGEPVMEHSGYYEDEAEKGEEVHIWYMGDQDRFETFMDAKDEILKNLKEKKLNSYRFAPVVGMKVQIHPSNAEKLIMVG